MKIHDPKLPNAIICDLDGTLALFGSANPYDRDFAKDILNTPIANILQTKPMSTYLIIMSGRNGKFEGVTRKWLEDNDIAYHYLHMREEDDNRKDSIVKEELYKKYIENKFNISFVLDDRNQVVELWRSLGLTCLQVNDGDF